MHFFHPYDLCNVAKVVEPIPDNELWKIVGVEQKLFCNKTYFFLWEVVVSVVIGAF